MSPGQANQLKTLKCNWNLIYFQPQNATKTRFCPHGSQKRILKRVFKNYWSVFVWQKSFHRLSNTFQVSLYKMRYHKIITITFQFHLRFLLLILILNWNFFLGNNFVFLALLSVATLLYFIFLPSFHKQLLLLLFLLFEHFARFSNACGQWSIISWL